MGIPGPEDMVLLFQVDAVRCAVAARDVHEILRAVALFPLPQGPAVVAGLADVRGTVVPVVDMRRRLGLAPQSLRRTDYIILLRHAGPPHLLGLWVTRVDHLEAWGTETHVQAGAALQIELGTASGVARRSDGLLLLYEPATLLTASEEASLAAAVVGPGG